MDRKKKRYIILSILTVWFLWYAFTHLFLVNSEKQTLSKIANSIEHESATTIDYLLNVSSCQNHKFLILVTSYSGHVELRSAHRRALPHNFLESLSIKRVFLLARIPELDKSSISQRAIENEHVRFGDLLQGSFMEAYRNLTIKHVMGLKWSFENCASADYVIKLDDDIVFNIEGLLNYINSITVLNRSSFLLGYVMRGMKPSRLNANKWYVTKNEYAESFYPPFLSGWMYITTPETAKILVSAAHNTTYFWIDDVFITGILASKMNINLNDVKYDHVFLEYYELLDCCLNDMLIKNIMCEYLIGPNGSNNNMIVKFINAIHICSVKKCRERPIGKPLNETCIVSKKTFPVNRGNPIINFIKLK